MKVLLWVPVALETRWWSNLKAKGQAEAIEAQRFVLDLTEEEQVVSAAQQQGHLL